MAVDLSKRINELHELVGLPQRVQDKVGKGLGCVINVWLTLCDLTTGVSGRDVGGSSPVASSVAASVLQSTSLTTETTCCHLTLFYLLFESLQVCDQEVLVGHLKSLAAEAADKQAALQARIDRCVWLLCHLCVL